MAPLFGPLTNANPYAPPQAYAPAFSAAPAYPAEPAASTGLAPGVPPFTRRRGPIRLGPPIRPGDAAIAGDAPIAIAGAPLTRPDRLFGPFASFAAGPSGL
jgi:hypothetical protein